MTDQPQRKKSGRKPTPRPDNAAIIEALNQSSGFVLQAAKRLKVDRGVLARWINEDPALQVAQAESKEALADAAESVFVTRALDKADPASQSFLPLLLRNLGRNAPPPPKDTDAPAIVIRIAPYSPREGT